MVKFRLAAASARFEPFTANDGVGSSSVIVIVAAALEIVEFEGLDRVTVKVSFNSSIASCTIVTGIFCVVVPAAKVSVPFAAT